MRLKRYMFGPRRRHYGRGRGGGHRGNMALLLLFMQMAQVGFDRIPPVTLCTIIGQVAIFLKLLPVPPIPQICVSAVNVWYKEDWKRLFTAAFFHLNDWHLYFNMVSFLWKGIGLERRYGSFYLAYLIAVFAVLCNVVTVGLGLAAEKLLHDPSYLSQCAAGFSGVIFALKVVTTYMLPPGITYVMGFLPVHSRLACWAELLAIQVMVPNASFLGHLAGILVGMAYVHGPLKYAMDTVASFGRSLAAPSFPNGDSGRSRFTGGGTSTGAGTVGGRTEDRNGSTGGTGMSDEEQLQEAIRRSLNERYGDRPPPSSSAPRATPSAPRPTPSAPPPPAPSHPPASPTLYPTLPARDLHPQNYGSNNGPYPDHPSPPYPGTGASSSPPYPGGSILSPPGASTSSAPPQRDTTSPSTNASPPSYGSKINEAEMRIRRLKRFDK